MGKSQAVSATHYRGYHKLNRILVSSQYLGHKKLSFSVTALEIA